MTESISTELQKVMEDLTSNGMLELHSPIDISIPDKIGFYLTAKQMNALQKMISMLPTLQSAISRVRNE